jgi:hypothetical protein
MAPYSRWVHPSFRQTLMDACDEFLQSTDCSNDKTWSKLITRVAKDITDIAKEKNESLPDDLEKVILMYLFFSSLIMIHISSVYAYGLATTHLAIPKRRAQQKRSRIHVGTQHHPGHGRLSLYVATSFPTAFQTSKRGFPTVEKKISESIVLRWQPSLKNSAKRKRSNVRISQWSGILKHCQKSFNSSKRSV